jgi:hypothetical protein
MITRTATVRGVQTVPSNDIDPTILKPIPGYANYFAGPDGNIYSRPRKGASREWRKVEARKDKHGYWVVGLRDGRGRQEMRPVHRLILLAFKGEPPPGKTQCRHMDGNKGKNCPENLDWGDSQDQVIDRIRHGTINRGTRSGRSKLTEEYVRDLLRRRGEGETIDIQAEADQRGVHYQSIWAVLRGETWKHIPESADPGKQTADPSMHQTRGGSPQQSASFQELLHLWHQLTELEQQAFLSTVQRGAGA